MNKLSEKLKLDMALLPGTINSGDNATGDYFDMAGFARALFVVTVGSAGGILAGTSVAQVKQATSAAGAGAKNVSGKSATIATLTDATEALVIVNAPDNGDTVTVNGLTFTKAAATAAADREFADAAGLETCVNHGVYGVPGVIADNDAGTVSLKADPRGDETITLATTDEAKLACAMVKAVAYIDLDASALDAANGFTHVALNVASTVVNIPTTAVILRGDGRMTPAQKVAASC